MDGRNSLARGDQKGSLSRPHANVSRHACQHRFQVRPISRFSLSLIQHDNDIRFVAKMLPRVTFGVLFASFVLRRFPFFYWFFFFEFLFFTLDNVTCLDPKFTPSKEKGRNRVEKTIVDNRGEGRGNSESTMERNCAYVMMVNGRSLILKILPKIK